MDYYIGIDIGTTSTKAVAFSLTGEVLAQKSLGYPILHPQQDRSEQQPEEILSCYLLSATNCSATTIAKPCICKFFVCYA